MKLEKIIEDIFYFLSNDEISCLDIDPKNIFGSNTQINDFKIIKTFNSKTNPDISLQCSLNTITFKSNIVHLSTLLSTIIKSYIKNHRGEYIK